MLETHLCVVGTWLRYTLGIWWYMYEVHVLVMLVHVEVHLSDVMVH
jgi:hypothetical protein